MSPIPPTDAISVPPTAAETRLATLLALAPDDLDAECFGLLAACEFATSADPCPEMAAWWEAERAYDQYLDDRDFGMLVAADAAACLDSRHWTA